MDTRPSPSSPAPLPAQAVPRTQPPKKALEVMANRLQVDATKLYGTLKATVFKGATDDEFLALVVVANAYQLNPLTREIFAFPNKRGGVVPVVSVDGWIHLVNDAKNYDGVEFAYEWSDEKKRIPFACTCIIYVKDRSHPCKVTEYYHECYRNTEPWNNMPARLMRHKALIQCGRVAFGFSGIYDEDEARDIINVTGTVVPAPDFMGPGDTKQIEQPSEREQRESQAEYRREEATKQAATQAVEAAQEPPAENVAEDQPGDTTKPLDVIQLIGSPIEDLTATGAVEAIKKVLEADGLTEAQAMSWAKKYRLAKPDQKELFDLSESKLKTILTKFNAIRDEIRKQ